MPSKEVTNLSEKTHSRALHRDKNFVIDQEINKNFITKCKIY